MRVETDRLPDWAEAWASKMAESYAAGENSRDHERLAAEAYHAGAIDGIKRGIQAAQDGGKR